MSKVTAPPLSFAAYERLFHAIHGVVSGHCRTPEKACFYFAFIGANLIWRTHQLPAVPVAGAAGYCFKEDNWLVLGSIRDGKVCSSLETFHCWIEIGDWVVDLSAPLLGRLTGSSKETVRPAMFQARAHRMWMAKDLNKRTCHFHTPNPALTTAMSVLLLKDAAFVPLVMASRDALSGGRSKICKGQLVDGMRVTIKLDGSW